MSTRVRGGTGTREKPATAKKPRSLWRCPNCGHRFVTPNMWHSCSNHTLAEHFRGCAPSLRPLFDQLLAFLRSLGPVTVIPQASRITFQSRVRFAGAVVRKQWLECGLWLKRRVDEPRFTRVAHYGRNNWGYGFRLCRSSDLDATLKTYLRESYKVGQQKATPGHRPRSPGG